MRQHHLWTMVFAIAIAWAGFSNPASAQIAPAYLLTNLGTLAGGTTSEAHGINSSNMIVGWSDNGSGLHQATAWTGSSYTINNLGMLAGDTQSEARGANAAGVIVGFSTNTAFTADKAVFFVVGGGPTNLNIASSIAQPVGGPVLANSRAEAISASGEIVGHAYSGNFNALSINDAIAGYYRNAAGTSVTRLDPPTNANPITDTAALSYGINSTSQVFGQADPGTGYLGSRWSSPSGSTMTPSVTYPSAVGAPAIITNYLGTQGNNANRIVGTANSDDAATSQAFVSDGTTTTLLNNIGGNGPNLLGNAYSINNGLTNIIVGSSSVAAGTLRATAWSWSSTPGALPNVTPIDLNSLVENPIPGFSLVEAYGVNDNGYIVGYGIFNGNHEAFLLTPVPEPGTLALCSLGLGGLAVRAWRRRKN